MGEEQIKLEGDIALKQRELKYKTIEVDGLKHTLNELLSSKETNEKLIEEQKDELTRIMNTISDARLNWSTEKAEQLAEIDEMRKGVQGILSKEAELVKKEIEINNKIEEEIKLRNQNSQTLLGIENEKKSIEFKENAIKAEQEKIEIKDKEIREKMEHFKEKVVNVLKEVNEL